MSLVLKSLNQKPIAVYPIYIDIAGSSNAGMMLSQLMYWFSIKDKIYKTNKNICDEIRLSIEELKSAKKKLKALDFIEISREGIPAKTYYKIDWYKYENALKTFTSAQEIAVGGKPTNCIVENPPSSKSTSQQPVGGKPTNCIVENPPSITETTTENTTKTTSSNEEKKTDFEFIKFLKNIRKEYTPKPDKKFYPNLIQVKSSETNEIGNLRLDVDGHLYATFPNHTKNLDGVDARHYWNYLYQHQDRILPLPKLKQKTKSTGDEK